MIKRLPLVWMFFLFMTVLNADANTPSPITSVDITTRTLAALPGCLHYKVKGVCFWQLNGVINTTAYLQHYMPDVVVSVFNQPGENPWFEMRNTLDQAGAATEQAIAATLAHTKAGGGQHELNNPQQQNTFFKAADVIGNPALLLLPTEILLLPSVTIPLKPYFQSMLDSTLWRGFPPLALPEQAYAMSVSLQRYIGKDGGIVTWGSAVPFEGKVATSNDAKAAAVIAQRAGNLITTTSTNSWGHLFQRLSTRCGKACVAATVQENSEDSQFQMIYPTAENTCQIFGQTLTFGEEAEMQTNGAYMWVLWRKYEGCIEGAGKYVGRT